MIIQIDKMQNKIIQKHFHSKCTILIIKVPHDRFIQTKRDYFTDDLRSVSLSVVLQQTQIMGILWLHFSSLYSDNSLASCFDGGISSRRSLENRTTNAVYTKCRNRSRKSNRYCICFHLTHSKKISFVPTLSLLIEQKCETVEFKCCNTEYSEHSALFCATIEYFLQ